MKCTIHSAKELVPSKTKYGIRYGCPVGGCTVVQWSGSSSTPADFGTRQARMVAHNHFDTLWQAGMFTRGKAYKALAKYLNLPQRKVHIGHFDITQCRKVVEFCEEVIKAK
ncbi:hypothetical protein LCGC14_0613180 [marine sediment metagenome]|uniref:Uncharacterized protein n=1 Tax=marine sediment metagenome TaxID=412755 RepID=A0A0F9TTF7_9ZZZZ